MQNQLNRISSKERTSFRLLSLLGILFILIAILATRFLSLRPDIKKRNFIKQIHGLVQVDTLTSKYILKSGLPFLELTSEEDDPLTLFHTNWSELYWRFAANVQSINPLGIIETQFPLVALYKPKPKPMNIPEPSQVPRLPEPSPQTTPQPETPNDATPEMQGDPAVFIYHAHTSESYIPSSGKDHLLNQKGDIVKVGSYLQEVLEQKYHIKCFHSETINDQYPFRYSYKRARETVTDYLQKHPATQVVIDLHRDATPGLPNSCMINGVKCATVAMVVGSDKMKLPHPHWRKNLAFAQEINDAMTLYDPGLSNGIILSEARYNQDMHTHAILAEFGDQDSTLEEAYRAADHFAAILNMVIKKDSSGETTLSKDN